MKSHHAWATWFTGRAIGGSEEVYVVQARSDFSLPTDAELNLQLKRTQPRGDGLNVSFSTDAN